MILTPHAIAGAGLASLIPEHPVWGFALGFASHFVLDAIPHWDYNLSSKIEDEVNPMNSDILIGKNFIFDLFKIGVDIFLGFFLSFIFFGLNKPLYFLVAILCGSIGGVFPDALQFVYYKWRHWPLTSLQRFHIKLHSKIELKNRPWIGLTIYLIFISSLVILMRLIFN